ncbi:hypothetical protein F5148DRAFT_1165973 [Russula earlei]|uniref:Uncharacterized protein n=1 Tax=Russula earlei TaxID=71964 RepID=A0ACC0ULT7_9AGAM|nr:hypothetical protein F5148DRAFT_1165973 [Russula earlei]
MTVLLRLTMSVLLLDHPSLPVAWMGLASAIPAHRDVGVMRQPHPTRKNYRRDVGRALPTCRSRGPPFVDATALSPMMTAAPSRC